MSEKKGVEPKEWALEPETEYRFELDPGTSVAIKVSSNIALSTLKIEKKNIFVSSRKAAPKFSDLNWQKERFIFSVLSARPQSIHGRDAFLR